MLIPQLPIATASATSFDTARVPETWSLLLSQTFRGDAVTPVTKHRVYRLSFFKTDDNGRSMIPSAMIVSQPAFWAMFAACIFVSIPPVPNALMLVVDSRCSLTSSSSGMNTASGSDGSRSNNPSTLVRMINKSA